MRYFAIDTISFNDKNGRVVPVKDIRPIPTYQINFELDTKESDVLDEISSRGNVYGENGEVSGYKIFDANIVELFDAEFDISKVRRLRIPI